MIRIAIAEDNSFLLSALTEKLSFYSDLKLKFHGANGKELIEKLKEDHIVDLILMDIQMPGMDGIEATDIIKNKYPQIKVLMLTVFDDEENIFNAIRAGADGYLLKETKPEELYKGIKDIIDGGSSMSPEVARKTLKLLRNPNIQPVAANTEEISLSNREIEILEQISKGLNYQLIAENLIISPGTVRKHIENIYKKLQVHNKVEALQKAGKLGII